MRWIDQGIGSSKVPDISDIGLMHPDYYPTVPAPKGRLAFQAARARIFDGATPVNGCTEAMLHRFRRKRTAELGLTASA